MKNIVTILKELGFDVPEDREQEITKAVAGSYVTTAEHEKKIARIESERDSYKDQLADAQNTIKKFDGIDPAKYQEELNGYKKRSEDAEKNYKAEIAKRDKNDLIDKALAEIKFSSKYAKQSIMDRLKADEDLRVKDGKLIGMNDIIASYRESDPDAFSGDNEPAKFTKPEQTKGEKPVTKESIMAIKSTNERRKAMAEHFDLFQD